MMKPLPYDIQYLRVLCLFFFSSPVSPLFDETDGDYLIETIPSPPPPGETAEAFLCRGCGNQIFHTSDGFVRRPSPHAFATYPLSTVDANENVLNVTVQTLVNPHGARFDLITVQSASTRLHGKPETEASWFDGYAWTVSACPRCGRHLGWKFTLVDDAQCPARNGALRDEEEDEAPSSFHGLILSQLSREKVLSNLIKLPKMKNTRPR